MEPHESIIPADTLGFSVPPEPPAAPVLTSSLVEREEVLALAPDERAALFETLIQQNSLVAVEQIARDLAFHAASPNTTIPQKLSIAEFHAKLAKLDKKQNDPAPIGGGYQLVINLGNTVETHRSVTIEQKTLDVADEEV